MSSDHQILAALGLKTKRLVRYFELVNMTTDTEKKKCYLCVTKHSLVFMRHDLSEEINKDGELLYEHIGKVVVDKESAEHFHLELLEGRTSKTWHSPKVLIKCDSRDLLLKHMQSSWQTDYMIRNHKVAKFPRASRSIVTRGNLDPEVMAFKEWIWMQYCGYKFMLPETFEDKANSIQAEHTGEYRDQKSDVSVAVHMHDIMSMEDLCHINREHIRWVAAQYKEHLIKEESHFYVLRNQQRPKRMNLVGDVAAWYGWELIIRTKSGVLLCMILRRQYIPPLCDCAQDIAILVRCSQETWLKSEAQLMLKAYLIADSVSPSFTTNNYPDMIQAKLDSLRFDEDTLEWVSRHVKLHSRWRREAKLFLRSVLKLFLNENLTSLLPKDVLTNRRYLSLPASDEEWEDMQCDVDLDDFVKEMKLKGEGLSDDGSNEEETEDGVALTTEGARNLWFARVARFFAWAIDGGILGSVFTLDKLIEGIDKLQDEETNRQVQRVLMFLLHMREVNPEEEWHVKDLKKYFDDPGNGGADRWLFNDRVMQQLISADYLKKAFGRNKQDTEYYKCLASLLKSKAGTNLKAYVCRLFMELKMGGQQQGARTDDDSKAVAVPALLSLVDNGSVYLATYASAALVNLSCSNELVKMQLMSHGLATAAVKNIRSKNDDLINYTLTLLVNLTKEAHHRYIMANAGVLPLLYDILTSSYHQCKGNKGESDSLSSAMLSNKMKEKILTHICSIMGHFCKEEEHRDHLITKFPHTIKCFVYMATHCQPCSLLMGKVLYVLKQLCAGRNDQKRYVGQFVIKHVCSVLQEPQMMKSGTADMISHAIQLLLMLASFQDNCLVLREAKIEEVLDHLRKVPATKMMDNFDDNKIMLTNLVEEAARRFGGL